MNRRSNWIGVAIGAFFLFTFGISTVRADSIHARQFRDLSWGQEKKLDLSDLSQLEAVAYLQNGHSNNGRHLGFGVASLRQGPKLDVVGYYDRAVAIPNPEPTTVVLFGTGLIVLGAYARRKASHIRQ